METPLMAEAKRVKLTGTRPKEGEGRYAPQITRFRLYNLEDGDQGIIVGSSGDFVAVIFDKKHESTGQQIAMSVRQMYLTPA